MAQLKNVKTSKRAIPSGVKIGPAQGGKTMTTGKQNTKKSTNKAC